MTKPPSPPVDYRTAPPAITPVVKAWQAWWEDNDMWDGFVQYTDLDTAKVHAAIDYIGEEYSWVPGDDPDDEAPDTILTWVTEHGRWYLLDKGQATNVQLYETRIYAPRAAVEERRERYAQAIRDSNATPEALAWWKAHPQLIPAAVYADAAIAVADAEQTEEAGASQ